MKVNKSTVKIYTGKQQACADVAHRISQLIKEKETQGKKLVLGLATGNTPIPLYEALTKMHQTEGLSFKNVVTFNLDEYYPISRRAPQSYYNFMQRNLFSHIDILPENVHIPNGEVSETELENAAVAYEQAIKEAGGIDFQVLGIGHNGHIGFNEPGSAFDSKTRKIELTDSTRNANSFEFATLDDVPHFAVSMGINTILQSKEIVLLAWGEGKAKAVQQSIEEAPTPDVPASLLQHHHNVTFYLDEAAAANLSR